ncbi:flagellar hook-basal body complex protein FliE [Novosphingobium sp. 1529]|uniref:flagellar hook-basal body complex protein FliE n=1 Tax=Novosphingobium sp. 1529 TaxID=3156424 RepID=UPI00339B205E
MSAINGIGAGGGIQQIMAMRQQIIDRSHLLQQIRTPESGIPAETNSPTGGFTDALKSALDTVNASQTKADGISAAYEKGETVDVAKVMLARQEAGVAFEATLQVRNKLLTAYQDIMRMGV